MSPGSEVTDRSGLPPLSTGLFTVPPEQADRTSKAQGNGGGSFIRIEDPGPKGDQLTAIDGFEGFKVHPLYDDFSTPCYDGQHQMILGGSWVACGDEASVWARFHFRPHFFQHAGFRVVQADHDGGVVRLGAADSGAQVYEDARMVDDYMVLHHGRPEAQMPWPTGPQGATGFPQRCADWLLTGAARYASGTARALDIGCAVGGASFALARGFDSVQGVDLSRAFIDAASTLQRDGHRDYFMRDEGDLGRTLTAHVEAAIDRSRVSFRQADACSLPAELADFDAVLLANLLCRRRRAA